MTATVHTSRDQQQELRMRGWIETAASRDVTRRHGTDGPGNARTVSSTELVTLFRGARVGGASS